MLKNTVMDIIAQIPEKADCIYTSAEITLSNMLLDLH